MNSLDHHDRGCPYGYVTVTLNANGVGTELSGYRTYFTTAADLAARCHRVAIEGRWATTMRFFAGATLLVIDLCRPREYADIVVRW